MVARLSPGAISESNSSHLPPRLGVPKKTEAGEVSTRAVQLRDDAAGDRVEAGHKDDRDRPRFPVEGSSRRGPACQDNVGLQADQLVRERSHPIGANAGRPKVHPYVVAIGPTQARERLSERREFDVRSDHFRRTA